MKRGKGPTGPHGIVMMVTMGVCLAALSANRSNPTRRVNRRGAPTANRVLTLSPSREDACSESSIPDAKSLLNEARRAELQTIVHRLHAKEKVEENWTRLLSPQEMGILVKLLTPRAEVSSHE